MNDTPSPMWFVLVALFAAIGSAFVNTPAVALSLWICAAALTVYLFYIAGIETLRARSEFIRWFAGADRETRDALGYRMPTMHIRYARGEIYEDFEGTGVPMWFVREFAERSTQLELWPLRDVEPFDDRGVSRERAREYWQTVKCWLDDMGWIISERKANNQTWIWKLGYYQAFRARYAPRELPNLAEIEG